MNKEELNHVFKHKTWNEIKTKDSWQLFKIMSEFVNGFEKMSKIGPCVTTVSYTHLTLPTKA